MSALPEELRLVLECDRHIRFILGRDNRVVFANALARRLLAEGGAYVSDLQELRFLSGEAQAALETAIMAARREPEDWQCRILGIGDGEWTALYAHLIDTERGDVQVVLQRSILRETPDLQPVADTFGLTAMETKVLGGLIHGQSPKRIGMTCGISVHTVRAHMRGIYAKLGTHSGFETQSLVLRLLN